ncbi:hypothetical protein [Endozoicomonas numazuensis]|uniref:Uncharacterized protein n=1 Tax=Endozoicomonas numazuensis TaxID=1137799 RepID=A0A081NFA5_9GAMM|nr:hypothetical protein [Endozoicomonas numazuensis]KEQ17128.1 hypothetical protein GZ78_14750 [Endozoicomonas numazuensis]
MLGSLSYTFLVMALTWSLVPIFNLLELKPLTVLAIALSIPIPTLFLTIKAVRGKKWSLTAIALSAVMATSHLTKELPIGIYLWLVGLTFSGIAFYCHVRLIDRGLKQQIEESLLSEKK